jgi:hypothetical protein
MWVAGAAAGAAGAAEAVLAGGMLGIRQAHYWEEVGNWADLLLEDREADTVGILSAPLVASLEDFVGDTRIHQDWSTRHNSLPAEDQRMTSGEQQQCEDGARKGLHEFG